ncbi:MAG: UDP-N-acetylmuramoyl-tripeptide--D-alanyl-D-alanine ligase [Gemmatimonadota bacterium]
MSARFESHEVRRALGLSRGESARHYTSVAIDSREVERGGLFVALPGERVDGADFVAQAARRGAAGAIVPAGRPFDVEGIELFAVPDTLRALGDLARFARRRSGARVVGVTGSSGKTTVKEMLALALAEHGETWATPGNLNSLTGLPLTILRATPGADYWVLEMGSNAPGEIARLAAIAEPDDAIVTTVGRAHLEGFGDVDGVLREKLALVRGAQPAGSVVVGDVPSILPAASRRIRDDVIAAGLEESSDFRPERFETGAESARFDHGGVTYALQVGGEHHLRDAVIAAALADAVGVPGEAAARGLSRYRPVGMRGAVVRAGDLTIVADCYNANPESFEAAIRFCESSFPGRPRSAVVGSMLELGSDAPAAHRATATRLLEAGFRRIFPLGEFRAAFGDAMRDTSSLEGAAYVSEADSVGAVVEELLSGASPGEVVLVKASRGERLERVVESLIAGANGEAA